ncbi:NAD(P)/FAD-dependent oxidoreductase [Stagnihabitans tardus]|uniref:Aminoacetone oxidase family FAD-binding enzyme n=1 Tax=Stagnihabitans tardus TaxID=2699202 RepID=A0AAE5BR61_9RHOB|nr:NAD(P)/FAD-dependent oxidoreductase [Stagnihabitans tardus]NBZ86195.1 aminoacetone oxidase family FAD-binding enzyme [Stagnihabitans tardus]
MKTYDAIILGAGAAGMMAAIEAGRRGRRVLVIDHAKSAGEKIRISGGGRCNFTNMTVSAERFLGQNPRFALSALKRFGPWDFISRVDAAGITWHEKALGQLFCDGKATQIVELLLRDMAEARVELWLDCAIGEVREGFTLATARGDVTAPRLVVATGGKSIPKMGATSFGYKLAEAFGLPVTETRPALVPLTFATQELEWMAPLSGVSLPVVARAEGGPAFPEALLFTHRGLSGPAVLQVSSYWREGQGVKVDLLPGVDVAAVLRAARGANGRQGLGAALAGVMPERLARHLGGGLAPEAAISTLSNAAVERISAALHGWQMTPVGSEGYRTAEVTLGGVDTAALDARTMEAKGVPGLYFVGEVVDVTGWLGGYNFQWAWSSGWAAGQAL